MQCKLIMPLGIRYGSAVELNEITLLKFRKCLYNR